MKNEYYIVSLKWTHKHDDWITFWRHDSNGYCWRKDWAGVYTDPEVDGYDTIRIETHKLEDLWIKDTYGGVEILVIPNSRSIRKLLGIELKDLKRLHPSH